MDLPKQRMAERHDGRATRYLLEQEEDVSSARAISREAREASVGWLANLARWDYYATLTYDPARTGTYADHPSQEKRPISVETCTRHFIEYHRAISALFDCSIRAAAAVERTKQGWPHVHALLNVAGVSRAVLRRAGQHWYQNHGYARISPVEYENRHAVTAYLLKYFTKQDCQVEMVGDFVTMEWQHVETVHQSIGGIDVI